MQIDTQSDILWDSEVFGIFQIEFFWNFRNWKLSKFTKFEIFEILQIGNF